MKQIMDLFLTFGRIGALTFGGGYGIYFLFMIVETDYFGVEPGNFLRKCKINVIYLHTKEKRKAVEY